MRISGLCRIAVLSAGLFGLAERRASATAIIDGKYQPFRVDFGFGYATAPAQKAYGGSISVEPKLNVLDFVAVGGRIEAAIMGGGNIGPAGSSEVSVKQKINVATLLQTDVYGGTGKVRPWFGLGVGFYTLVGQSTATSSSGASVDQKAGRYFGAAPQVGIELGGFRVSAVYNAIFGAQVEVHQSVGGTDKVTKYSNNYASVALGWRQGGRRRPNANAPGT